MYFSRKIASTYYIAKLLLLHFTDGNLLIPKLGFRPQDECEDLFSWLIGPKRRRKKFLTYFYSLFELFNLLSAKQFILPLLTSNCLNYLRNVGKKSLMSKATWSPY